MIDTVQQLATELAVQGRATPPHLLALLFALALACFALPVAGLQALRRRTARRGSAERAAMMPPSRGAWSNRLWQEAGRGRSISPPGGYETPVAADPSWRLHAVAANGFRPSPLLNRSQARLLPVLEKLVYTRGSGHRLMARTALSGAVQPVAGIGASADRLTRALRALEGAHLEFALFDGAGLLVAAIEVERPRSPGPAVGGADCDAALRREVLRKAGVPLVRVQPFANEAEVAALLLPHLAPARAP
jgi:hypothetical protein